MVALQPWEEEEWWAMWAWEHLANEALQAWAVQGPEVLRAWALRAMSASAHRVHEALRTPVAVWAQAHRSAWEHQAHEMLRAWVAQAIWALEYLADGANQAWAAQGNAATRAWVMSGIEAKEASGPPEKVVIWAYGALELWAGLAQGCQEDTLLLNPHCSSKITEK